MQETCASMSQFIKNLTNYDDFVRPLLYHEFDRASVFDTKLIIQQRVIKEIANRLDIKNVFSVATNTSKQFVHPDICTKLENLYKQVLTCDVKTDTLTVKFSVFKSSATDFYDIPVIKNLIKEFQRCLETNKDVTSSNKKEKIIKDNRLNVILAVDGFQGSLPADLINYLPNLSVGYSATKTNERHILGVRAIYDKIPSILTGTDSAYILNKVLLQIFAKISTDQDQKTMIQKELGRIDDYLVKMAQHYKEIESVISTPFIDELIETYKSKLNDHGDLVSIATERLNSFWSYLKKKHDGHKQEETKTVKEEEPVEQKPVKVVKKRAKITVESKQAKKIKLSDNKSNEG